MINTTYNPITGVNYSTTEQHPSKVTKTKRINKKRTAIVTKNVNGTKSVNAHPKVPQKQQLQKQEKTGTPKTKTKRVREGLNTPYKIVTTTPTKNPVNVRYDRRRTLALKRKRQDKQALQEFAFTPIAPDKADNLDAFLQKTVKASSNIYNTMEIILKSPAGTFDKTMITQLAEIISALQYIHKSIDFLPEVTKKEKNRTLNSVGKALNIVKKTRKKLAEQKTR